MVRRIMVLILASVMLFAFLETDAASVRAADRSTSDVIAEEIMKAVNAKQTTCSVTAAGGDISELLHQLFAEYPMLLHYYERAESIGYQTHMDITFFLRNTEDALDELWVVNSDEELLAVLGLGLLEARKEITFVTGDDYCPSNQTVEDAIELLHDRYPVAYMGYHGWLSSWVGYNDNGVRDYTITIRYFYDLDASTLLQWRKETEQAVIEVMGSVVAQDMPDYLKALLIHDWIIEHSRYNSANMEEAGNHLAYGALVKGSCVCMGYAEAGVLLFQLAGLEARYITGMATNSAGQWEAHSWNAVKIDGEWYLVDITWDDPITSDGTDVLRYDYFLLTDSQLERDHTWERDGIPVCNGGLWNSDRALAAREQDPGGYTQYHTASYMTLNQVYQFFRQSLVSGAEAWETRRRESTTESAPPETVETTEPEMTEAVGKEPEITVEPTQRPIITEQPVQVLQGQDHSSGGSVVWLGVLFAAVIVIVAAAVIAIRTNRARRRRRSKYSGRQNSGTRKYVNFD